jgi:hypothetical protein
MNKQYSHAFVKDLFVKNTYLRAFVIGSSFFVFFLFFYSIIQIPTKKRNYHFYQYTFIAPFFLGLMNMVSLYISDVFNITRQFSLFVTSISVPFALILFAKTYNIYNFTKSEWVFYIWYVFLLYIFVFNVVVYYLDKYV